MTMNGTYKKDGFTLEEYVIRCSQHELEVIRMCMISALQTFEDIGYTREELDILVNGMTLKEIDNLTNVLYNIPF